MKKSLKNEVLSLKSAVTVTVTEINSLFKGMLKVFVDVSSFTVFFILLSGCSAYQFPKVDLQKELIPVRAISKSNISVFIPYHDIERIAFTVIDTDHDLDRKAYGDVIVRALESIGFNNVITKREFAQLIIDRGIDINLSDTVDIDTLHTVQKSTGPFIFIKTELTYRHGGMNPKLWILNPEKPELLVEMSDHRVGFAGLDRDYIYPTLNLLSNWYRSSLKNSN